MIGVHLTGPRGTHEPASDGSLVYPATFSTLTGWTPWQVWCAIRSRGRTFVEVPLGCRRRIGGIRP